MGRKPAPQPLALSESALPLDERSPAETALQINSPAESFANSRSPRSPRSPFRFADKKGQAPVPSQPTPSGSQAHLHVADLVQPSLDDRDGPQYPPISATFDEQQQQQEQQQRQQYQQYQQYQPQPQPQPQHKHHGRHRQNDEKASKSNFFFHFGKSSKSTERLPQITVPSSQFADHRDESAPRGGDSLTAKQLGRPSDSSSADYQTQKTASSVALSRSEAPLTSPTAEVDNASSSTRKGKPKPFGRIVRTRSTREDGAAVSPSPLSSNLHTDSPFPQDAISMRVVEKPDRAHQPVAPPMKTAPIVHQDRAFRDMMAQPPRNHSAERANHRDVSANRDIYRPDRDPRTQSSSLRENGGSTFFNGLKNSSSRAADMISKGLFGKSSRSGSTTEREPAVDDEHYVLKVINKPLVQQTRLTRISKRLEDSRDKTEFWMPAFPWRAIDYLNYKGTDVEGLYRVPGSGPQVKKWQRKFDEEYDVDLFAQDDLYDINIIGSMLKAWLRELPDELFPKAAQERIARECAGSETVPQMLVDELSNLSPFNYYLLFAITCHLSLLLAHSDKNKMDFRNLCICFQPCMKIDAFSFKFLVCDWRDCWKGCRNEAEYIEQEYSLFDLPPPTGITSGRAQLGDAAEIHAGERSKDRQMSSSDSSKQSEGDASKSRLKKKPTAPETGSVMSNSTISTTLTIESQRVQTPPSQSGDLRPLSPIKPLSPLGF